MQLYTVQYQPPHWVIPRVSFQILLHGRVQQSLADKVGVEATKAAVSLPIFIMRLVAAKQNKVSEFSDHLI